MKQQKKMVKSNEFIPDKTSIYYPFYEALVKALKGITRYEIKWNNRTLPYLEDIYKDNSIKFNKAIFSMSQLRATCSMKELCYLENDLEDKISQIDYISNNKLFNVGLELFKLKFSKFLEDPYSSTQTIIHNCIKDGLAEDILSKSGLFKKIAEYKGNHGIVCTYMWKK